MSIATVVLQALCDDVEPDIEDVTAQIDAADFASFEQSASRETHRHHATYMTAFYQRVALAAVLGSDPYRAGEEAMVEAALQELARAGAIPKRRRKLARRAMAGLVETSLATRASHGDAQLRRGLEARTAILDELQRLSRPPLLVTAPNAQPTRQARSADFARSKSTATWLEEMPNARPTSSPGSSSNMRKVTTARCTSQSSATQARRRTCSSARAEQIVGVQNTPQPRASRPVSPAAGKPTPPSNFSQEFTEDMPPIGSDRILTSAQLKYCLAESIRLDAASLQVQETDDKYDDFRYDGMIADYNRRCSHNRYHHDTYEAAQRAVELQRARLSAEGAKRFHNSSDPVIPNLETGPRERSRIIR